MSKSKTKPAQNKTKKPSKAPRVHEAAELNDALERSRQEQFIQNILKGMRTSDAYRAAGYTAKNDATAAACASRMLKKANVRKRLNDLRQRAAEKATLDAKWIIERLMRNASIALGDETVKQRVKLKDSNDVVELEVTERDASAANKALELLGKTSGIRLFVEQVEHGGAGEFDQYTDEDLDRFIMERQAMALYDAEPGIDSVN